MIMTRFDRDALYDVKLASTLTDRPLRYYRKSTDIPAGGRSMLLGTRLDQDDLSAIGVPSLADANYSDQIPPFTITLTSQNEYGKTAVMALLGVEFINEGSGISIDDIVSETQYTFVARAILGWRPVIGGNLNAFDPAIVGENSPIAAIRQAYAARNAAKTLGS